MKASGRWIALALLLASFVAGGQTLIKFTSFPTASLTGGEYVYVVQGSGCAANTVPCTDYKTTTQAIANLGGGGGGGGVSSVNINASGILSFTGGPIISSGVFNPVWSGSAGGIPCFTSASNVSSTATLALSSVLLGGGAGNCPTSVSGTSTQTLHGNGTFGQVNLSTDVTNITSPGNGGTGISNTGTISIGANNVSISGGNVSFVTGSAGTVATIPAGTPSLGFMGLGPFTTGAILTSNYPFALADNGTRAVFNCSTVCTATIPGNATVSFNPNTFLVMIQNLCGSGNNLTVHSVDTMNWLDTGATGDRTIQPCGYAWVFEEGLTTKDITGKNIS